jgi:hypothetical protein
MPRVWEDGEELTQKNSVPQVESVSGSYYVDESSDPWVIYIHPRNSTDPTRDGKLYEWSARGQAVSMMGGGEVTNSTIEGIVARRPLENNGAVTINAGGTIKECLVIDGGKHHFLHGGGGVFRDSIIYGSSPNRGSLYAIGLVYFHDRDTTGRPWDITVRKMGMVEAPYTQGLNTRAHSGFKAVDVESVWSAGENNPALMNLHTGEVRGVYIDKGCGLGSIGNHGTLKYAALNSFGKTNRSGTNGEFRVENSIIMDAQLKRQASSAGQNVVIKNCVVIVSESGKWIFRDFKGRGTTFDFRNCLIIGFGREPVRANDRQSVTGDNCIFFNGYSGSEVLLNTGTPGESLSELQSRTGAFGNSVFLTNEQYSRFWRGDWRRGDVRFDTSADVTGADGTVYSGTLPDGTELSEVGQQAHWDWEEEKARRGPRTQWPTVPRTLSECKEYVRAPDSWDWSGSPPLNRKTVLLGDRNLTLYRMDGAPGSGEPDLVGENDLMRVNGSVDSAITPEIDYRATTSDFDYRDTTKDSFLYRTTGDGFSGVFDWPVRSLWMAFLLRIGEFGGNAIWGKYRGAAQGSELLTTLSGGLELILRLEFGQYEVTVPATSGTFAVCQCWYNPVEGEMGVRFGEEESTRKVSYHNHVRRIGADFHLGGSSNSAPEEADFGAFMAVDVPPSKADRDWIDNDGAFRSPLEIQNREVIMKKM